MAITKGDLLFYRDYAKREALLRSQIERQRNRVDLHSVQYDKVITKGGPERDLMAEHAAIIDELEREYIKLTEEHMERYQRIMKAIKDLPATEMQIILLRYQRALPWSKIRREMHYSQSQLFYIHNRALTMLSEGTSDKVGVNP